MSPYIWTRLGRSWTGRWETQNNVLHKQAQQESLPIRRDLEGADESLGHILLSREVHLHLPELLLRELVGLRARLEAPQNHQSLVAAADGHQPAGRFGQVEAAEDKEEGSDNYTSMISIPRLAA